MLMQNTQAFLAQAIDDLTPKGSPAEEARLDREYAKEIEAEQRLACICDGSGWVTRTVADYDGEPKEVEESCPCIDDVDMDFDEWSEDR